jgi:hypothetical protein
MKIALIDIAKGNKIGVNYRSVNKRNFFILEKELNASFFYTTSQLKTSVLFDVIIFGFASRSNEYEKTKDFVLKNKNSNLFWIIGEYEQDGNNPPLYYSCKESNKKYEAIRNFETKNKKQLELKSYFLNLNLLIAKEPNQLTQKKYDCIYYGRWREDRAKYFKRYIQNGMYLSTSTKNMKKFKHAGCNPKYLDTISWEERKETLNLFRYSLYIEDEYTHNVFNNLANRWYEAGFCNNVVFFDVNCWNTIRKSEIGYFEEQIKDYIVSSHEELQAKIEYCNQDFERHLAIQKGWRLNQMVLRQDMINELKRIIENSVKTA